MLKKIVTDGSQSIPRRSCILHPQHLDHFAYLSLIPMDGCISQAQMSLYAPDGPPRSLECRVYFGPLFRLADLHFCGIAFRLCPVPAEGMPGPRTTGGRRASGIPSLPLQTLVIFAVSIKQAKTQSCFNLPLDLIIFFVYFRLCGRALAVGRGRARLAISCSKWTFTLHITCKASVL